MPGGRLWVGLVVSKGWGGLMGCRKGVDRAVGCDKT